MAFENFSNFVSHFLSEGILKGDPSVILSIFFLIILRIIIYIKVSGQKIDQFLLNRETRWI